MSITQTEATAAKADYKATSDANLAKFNSQIDALVSGAPPVTGESAPGTTIMPGVGQIIDSKGYTWTITTTPNEKGWNVLRNGAQLPKGGIASSLRYCAQTVLALQTWNGAYQFDYAIDDWRTALPSQVCPQTN